MYNAATMLTIAVGVAFMYWVLFAFAALAAAAVIPVGYLRAVLGRTAGWHDYGALVWLATSIGTIAGALGSSLEDGDAVRRAAYSLRERERRARHRRPEEEERGT